MISLKAPKFTLQRKSGTKKHETHISARVVDDDNEDEENGFSNQIAKISSKDIENNENPNKKGKSSSQSIELNLDELDFKPNCVITRKESISAIQRAVTQRCKQEIANISCLINEDKLYPKYLPRFCQNKQLTKKESRPSSTAKVSQPVKIAFIMSLNGRAVRQVKRLIKVLYSKRHFFYIHVDARQDYMFRELLKLEALPNVKLSRNRMATIWGGASLLTMLLNSIKELLTLSSWDFVINLSESDFPIKPLSELEAFLTANRGSNFVKSHGQDTKRFITKQGLDKTFYECDAHMWRLGDRVLPQGIILDGGSDWVALSRDFCKFIINGKNELLDGLLNIYKYTLLPAESFFHTVLQNSKFCTTVIDNNLHITNWRRKLGCKCQYKHIVDWCGCSPNDFKSEDWPKLLATTEKASFFARKFEPVISQEIINRVENWILNKNDLDLTINRYLQNDYHHLDPLSFNEDGRISVYYILAIIAKKRMNSMCDGEKNSEHILQPNVEINLKSIYVKEVNLFFESDIFMGLVISFTHSSTKTYNASNFEVFVRPSTYFQLKRTGSPSRLMHAQVCSEYDAKEQVFRNFGCILHPYSQIGVKHKWLPGPENISATFVWVDPSLTVAGSFEIKIESGEKLSNLPLILYHKPLFNQPLAPGKWKLLILINWVLIAETTFVINPFIFYNGNIMNKEIVKYFHSGPLHLKYIDHNFTAVEALLGFKDKKSSRIRILMANSRKYGKDLQKWAENLVQDSWSVQDICYVSPRSLPCHNAQVDSCFTTHWSSLFPDPKSEIK
ncbi:xylosyltransferase oxt-like protein [Dinothrombium tinctorium]|uniref:protein xylosyltransferase n=1 Tax=Dinothrombium tinctorium TaxID=1965070 RepID=A0A3S3PVJ5_9ACAR|nr:xylosyltransferase oxt-like protein [Dinothrombium tinctorium]RWS08909.1 xylosyltransferase oxt-like protein [Dinothrombium tinctorium]RWS09337.1 xylosyltransferase oxt-like protein [Dinothrombium tinctorium]